MSRSLAVVAGLVLAATAVAGCGDDAEPSDGSFIDNSGFDEDIDAADEANQAAEDKKWHTAQVEEELTGHIVTFPDGSTARCVVLTWSSDAADVECI